MIRFLANRWPCSLWRGTQPSVLQPPGHVAPGRSHPPSQLLISRLLFLEQAPESRGVVHIPGVAQFVDEDVAHQRSGDEEELVVDADRAACRATCPAGPLPPDGDLAEGKALFLAHCPQPGNQVLPGFAGQPPSQSSPAHGNAVNIATQSQLSRGPLGDSHSGGSRPMVTDGPRLSDGSERYPSRQGGLSLDESLLLLHSPDGSFDPAPLLTQNARYEAPVEPPGNHDLQHPFGRNPQRSMRRSSTLAHSHDTVHSGDVSHVVLQCRPASSSI